MADVDLVNPVRAEALRDAEVVTCPGVGVAGKNAVLRVTDLRQWIRNALPDAAAALRRCGVGPAGPPTVVLHPRPDGTIRVTAGYPVDVASPAEGLCHEMLPAGPAVRAVHAGSHESLLSAYDRLMERSTVRVRGAAPVMWEEHLIGPDLTDAPAAWRTAVVCPLDDVTA